MNNRPESGDLRWHTSSYSGTVGNCVEVAALREGRWAVRDTKDRTRPPLTFGPVAWTVFLGAVRDGSFGDSDAERVTA